MFIDKSKPVTQAEFGDLVGVSQKSVSDLCTREVLKLGQPLEQWLKAYCAHLREQAAGRATNGELNLATERAALAREQKIRIEMQNAVTRREYGPIDALEQGLTDAMVIVAKRLETIPEKLKRASDLLTADDIDLVTKIITQIRNEIAATSIDWFGDKTETEEYDAPLEEPGE